MKRRSYGLSPGYFTGIRTHATTRKGTGLRNLVVVLTGIGEDSVSWYFQPAIDNATRPPLDDAKARRPWLP